MAKVVKGYCIKLVRATKRGKVVQFFKGTHLVPSKWEREWLITRVKVTSRVAFERRHTEHRKSSGLYVIPSTPSNWGLDNL